MPTTIKLDNKGRVSIPRKAREQAGLHPGDTLVLVIDPETDTLHLRKITDPFDGLAMDAVSEYEAGQSRSLREIAEEAGIDLNDEHGDSVER